MFWFLLLAAFVLANVEAYTHKEANAYIDNVIDNTFAYEQQYRRLDPYILPDINVPLISKRKTENQANISKGRLINLSKPRRSGDCSVPSWQFSNVSFTCTLNFPNQLQINYTANVTFDNMQLIFYPKIHIADTAVRIQVTTNKYENLPHLKLFYVSDTGHMTVTTKMISVGNLKEKIEPPIREALVSKSTTNLHKALSGHFQDALAFSIYKTPIAFVEN